MAKVITTELQHSGASGANITLDSSKNVTCENNLTVDGTTTLTGAVTLPAGTTSDTLSFRNLIVNGGMNVAQRGTTSTSTTYRTVDRMRPTWAGTDEALTQAQHALTSSDTGPWAKGFRNSLHLTNGNQTSGAGAADSAYMQYRMEAQDIANSGWDYTSASSYLTLSFWVKSSVAQTFYVDLQTHDGTAKQYSFAYTCAANTWLKVEHSIPGHADLSFDNNNAIGLTFTFSCFLGTDYTNSSASNSSWRAYAAGTMTLDQTSTWWTTNDATWEITGLQLEVGSTATDFEHRSYGEELARCQRYYYKKGKIGDQSDDAPVAVFFYNSGTTWKGDVEYPVTMRTPPSLDVANLTDAFRAYGNSQGHNSDTLGLSDVTIQTARVSFVNSSHSTSNLATGVRCNATGAYISFNAEL